jgi:hypothetical protein
LGPDSKTLFFGKEKEKFYLVKFGKVATTCRKIHKNLFGLKTAVS